MTKTLRGFFGSLVAVIGLCSFWLLSASGVKALPSAFTQFAGCQPAAFFAFPSWYACLPGAETGTPRIEALSDLWLIAFPLVESGIKAAAYLAVGFIIWGGFEYITSGGDPGKIKMAGTTIVNALIGLGIAIVSIDVVQYFASQF